MRTVHEAIINAIWNMQQFRVTNNWRTYDKEGNWLATFSIMEDEEEITNEIVMVPDPKVIV